MELLAAVRTVQDGAIASLFEATAVSLVGSTGAANAPMVMTLDEFLLFLNVVALAMLLGASRRRCSRR